jgi:peptidoglycan/xylan/chitin deacetylase (PgdA/CDA1 family)
MSRGRIRLGERSVFALLLLLVGIILPLIAAFSAPPSERLTAGALPTARVVVPTAAPLVLLPTRVQLRAGDQRPTTATFVPRAPASTLVLPSVTPSFVPTAGAAAPPPSTVTNTPEPLAPVLGPADGTLPRAVPTLFPTVPVPTAGGTPPVAEASPQSGTEASPSAPAPILMYHYIRTVDQASDPLGYALSVTPELFEQHLAWLHDQGYTTVRMDALARCMRGAARCPARVVALTFDDGYADAFTTALPALRRYGFTATFYIISGFVGQPGYMSWEQLAALRDAGMEIGAHTIDHLDLTSLDSYEAARQIAQSKADLERGLGINVVSFCYPTGLYNAAIEDEVRAAGYLSATTTRWDSDYSDILALPRRRIEGGTAVEGFAAIMQ